MKSQISFIIFILTAALSAFGQTVQNDKADFKSTGGYRVLYSNDSTALREKIEMALTGNQHKKTPKYNFRLYTTATAFKPSFVQRNDFRQKVHEEWIRSGGQLRVLYENQWQTQQSFTPTLYPPNSFTYFRVGFRIK